MNDFDYDVMQRKRLARNAQYRKGTRGGRTCRLSTDYLTHKQWKELNGEVMSYKLNEPMTWGEFKTIPIHIQSEYLKWLITSFKANSANLAQMFGVTSATVRRHIEANRMQIRFKVGNSMTVAEREAWECFLNRGETQPTESEPLCKEKHIEQAIPNLRETKNRMSSFSASFDGKIDVSEITNTLLRIIGADATGHIEIVCTLDKT